jgi:hypothetical protein
MDGKWWMNFFINIGNKKKLQKIEQKNRMEIIYVGLF